MAHSARKFLQDQDGLPKGKLPDASFPDLSPGEIFYKHVTQCIYFDLPQLG